MSHRQPYLEIDGCYKNYTHLEGSQVTPQRNSMMEVSLLGMPDKFHQHIFKSCWTSWKCILYTHTQKTFYYRGKKKKQARYRHGMGTYNVNRGSKFFLHQKYLIGRRLSKPCSLLSCHQIYFIGLSNSGGNAFTRIIVVFICKVPGVLSISIRISFSIVGKIL